MEPQWNHHVEVPWVCTQHPQSCSDTHLLSVCTVRNLSIVMIGISLTTSESEKWKWSHSVMSNSSWLHGLQPTRLLRPWDFPGKSTGVGCHCLLCWCLSDLSSNNYFRIFLWFLRDSKQNSVIFTDQKNFNFLLKYSWFKMVC